MNANSLTLAGLGRPDSTTRQWVYYVLLAVAGSALLWASAKIQIPFYPVPQTLTTLVVLGIGAAYGWKLGAATIGLYLLEGALGLPVFAGTPERGIGLAYMMGPTGGFLAGYVVAAALVGTFAERGYDRHAVRLFAVMLAGAAIVYGPGLAWLAIWYTQFKDLVPGDAAAAAVTNGLMPFIYGDVLKAALAAVALPAAWYLIGRR